MLCGGIVSVKTMQLFFDNFPSIFQLSKVGSLCQLKLNWVVILSPNLHLTCVGHIHSLKITYLHCGAALLQTAMLGDDWVVWDQWSAREDQGGWAVARLTVREEFGVRNGEKCAAEGGDSQCGSSRGWTWRKQGGSSSICTSPMCLLVELQSFMPYLTLYFIRAEITNATYGWCESVMCTDYISHNASRFSAPQSDVNQIPVFQLLHLKWNWRKYPEIIPNSRCRRNEKCD